MIDIDDLQQKMNAGCFWCFNPSAGEFARKMFYPYNKTYVYVDDAGHKVDTFFVEENYIPIPTYDSHPILLDIFKRFKDTEPRYDEILQAEDPYPLIATYLDHGIEDQKPYHQLQSLCEKERVRVAIQWCEENGFAYTYEKETSEFDDMTSQEIDDYLYAISAKVRKEEAERLGYDEWDDIPLSQR